MSWKIKHGDVLTILKTIPNESVHCVVTSPPYWGLRDYKVDGQIGLEKTPEEYTAVMVDVFREVKRVLRKDGTLWLNLGESYATPKKGNTYGSSTSIFGRSTYVDNLNTQQFSKRLPPGLKHKDLCGISWRVAFALQADGWYLRSDIIWAKPNPMPESVKDRPTRAHEYLFLMTKSQRYYYDADAIKQPVKDSSLRRIAQSTFFEQDGGPKDGVNPNRSCRKALENAARAWGRTPSGWEIGPGAHGKGKIGRYKPTVFGGNKADGYGTRKHSGKPWQPSDGGSGAGFVGHSGNRKSDGTIYLKANARSVWWIATQPFKEGHFATFPEKLVEPCILAGCPPEGVVLDPFCGSGTVGMVALKLGRSFLGIELHPLYAAMATRRIGDVMPLFT